MVYKNRIVYLLLFQISCIQAAQRADAFLACQDQVVPESQNLLVTDPDVPAVPTWAGPLAGVEPRVLFPSDHVPGSKHKGAVLKRTFDTSKVPNRSMEEGDLEEEVFDGRFLYICADENLDEKLEAYIDDPRFPYEVRMVVIQEKEYYKINDPSFRKDQQVPDQEAPSSSRKRKADGDHPGSPNSKARKFSPHSVQARVVVSLRGDQGAGVYSFGGEPGMAGTLRRAQDSGERVSFSRASRTRDRMQVNDC